MPEGDYRPYTWGQLLRTPFALYVRLGCKESGPRAVQRMPNSPVCSDSCLEFFLNPVPDESRFLNFEFNARGAMLLGLNENGSFRCLDPSLQTGCFPHAVVKEDEWGVWFCVPDTLIQRFFPKWKPEGAAPLRGNFYKCGDATQVPHYGSWSFVSRRPIDFHSPECFGEFLMQTH